MSTRPLNIAIVGATGNVGTEMLKILAESSIAVGDIRAFASPRSAGKEITFGDRTIIVESLSGADVAGLDVALFSAGAVRAREHAPRFAEAGVLVIDNSSAFRTDDSIPLVVPEVNADTMAGYLPGRGGIIANPNCSTIQLVVALKPILDAAGLTHVQVTTFQAVSGTGKAAVDELMAQTADIGGHATTTGFPDYAARKTTGEVAAAAVYPHTIAHNALALCGDADETGVTEEEAKLLNESRRILGTPRLQVGATCVRVPVINGHSEAVHLTTREPITADEVRTLLAHAPGISVVDAPGQGVVPTPRDASGQDDVLVGRIRNDQSRPNGIAMFVVADNLRKGAALNAVQILEVANTNMASAVNA